MDIWAGFASLAPLEPLLGGVFIGLAVASLLAGTGELFGVSSVVGGLLSRSGDGFGWRSALLAGLLTGGVVLQAISPAIFEPHHPRSNLALIGAGLLVGFGSRLAHGCTSGHGVCGISRFSPRSLLATALFMLVGMIVVLLFRIGGAS